MTMGADLAMGRLVWVLAGQMRKAVKQHGGPVCCDVQGL